MGAYIEIFFPHIQIVPVSIGIAVLLGVINLFGSKKSGRFQTILVICLLILLLVYIASGIPRLEKSHFENFIGTGWHSIMSTAGLVYISYIGITNAASLS